MMSSTIATAAATTAALPVAFMKRTNTDRRSRMKMMTIRCDAGEGESELKIGARVRVKVPLKVYHVPKVPEVDLTGREGTIKQNVTVWKDNKRISANLPYKVEFIADDIQGPRGPLKFVAHLKDDEFQLLS